MANLKNTVISDTGFFKLPAGDTAARPASPAATQLRFNTEKNQLEHFWPDLGEWLPPNNSGVIATGGDSVYDINNGSTPYRVHVFTNTSTFSVSQSGEAEYLIVAGGGGGGGTAGSSAGGGGGGAGGLLSGKMDISTGNYDIQIGNGGVGGNSPSDDAGDNGSDSTAFGLTAVGGGGGGTRSTDNVTGKDGGSGGGAGSHNNSRGGLGTSGQGNDGGSDLQAVQSGDNPAAGGGGAGGPGSDTLTSLGPAGTGGIGVFSEILGIPVYFAGGGGGGRQNSPGNIPGGLGGGGFGSGNQDVQPAKGTPNTGGGGGGCPDSSEDGANGGSGIVVIRYPLRQNNPETAAGQDVRNGLVLDLDFAKPTVYSGSGSVVTDSRLNGNEGDLVNGPEFVNPRTHRSAFEFDGSNQYIEGNGANISNGQFTINIWAKPTAVGDRQLFGVGTTQSTNQAIFTRFNSATSYRWGFWSDYIDGTFSDVLNRYNLFTMILRTNNQLEIWQDGSLRNSKSSGGYSGNNIFNLGREAAREYQYFEGSIASAQFYSRAFSADEISEFFEFTRWRFGV